MKALTVSNSHELRESLLVWQATHLLARDMHDFSLMLLDSGAHARLQVEDKSKSQRSARPRRQAHTFLPKFASEYSADAARRVELTDDWAESDPWITGSVNLLQGSVDISFPIQGSKGSGKALFTSIRRSADASFEISES